MSDKKKIRDSLPIAPDAAPARVIFEHITAADDERRIKRSERDSRQMGHDTLIGASVGRRVVLGERCSTHGTPDCMVCRPHKANNQIAEPYRSFAPAVQPPPPLLPRWTPPTPKKISPRQREREEKIAAELAARRSDEALADANQREKTKKMQFHVVEDIRKTYGYDARELAKFLDRLGFNTAKLVTDLSLLDTDPKFAKLNLQIARKERKRAPKTMIELCNMLPLKEMPLFSDDEITLYKGCAARNRKAKDRDAFLELENKIIHRAWDLALLPRKRGLRPDDSERDLDENYDLEIKSGTIGDTTVTAGETETGQLKQMTSFDRGPMHQQRGGGEDDPEDASASLDDEAEDSLD